MARRVGAVGLGTVLIVAGLAGPAMGASDDPFGDDTDREPEVLLVAPGDVDLESPVGCVLQQTAEGVEVGSGIAGCGLVDFDSSGRPGMHTLFPLGFGGSDSTFHGTVNCGSSVDPRIAGESGEWRYGKNGHTDPYQAPGRNSGGWYNDGSYQDLADEADQQWQEYVEALYHAAMGDTFGEDPETDRQLREKMEKELKEANEAINKRDAWKPAVSDSGDSDGDDGTAVARPSAENACAEVALLVAQCNASNWQAPACQEALSRMGDCDPSIAMPGPDQNEACEEYEKPDLESVLQTQALICSMRIRPEPGQDPCVGVTVGTRQFQGYRPTAEGGPPCGSELALTTPDQCQPTLTVVNVEQRWRDYVAEVLERVGGMGGFVIVMPQPYSGGANDPRTCDPKC